TSNGAAAPAAATPQVTRFTESTTFAAKAPAEAASAKADGNFSATLLAVVAELTGYPQEMIDLDMDMEADLGIDSIKRLEILAATQERAPGMREVDSQYMGSLRTLQDIINYVSEEAPDLAETPQGKADSGSASSDAEPRNPQNDVAAVPQTTADGFAVDITRRVLVAADAPATKSRGPLNLPRDCDILITRDDAGIADRLAQKLNALGHSSRFISPLGGGQVLNLPESYDEAISGLIVIANSTATTSEMASRNQALQDAFGLARKFGPALQNSGNAEGALFATISRMDGKFGLTGDCDDATSGGLPGLSKTASHEWADVTCRAIDVDVNWNNADKIATLLVDELLHEGPLEVGLTSTARHTLQLQEVPAQQTGASLHRGDVVIASGGARGVTAACLLELARKTAPTLVLLGRSSAPVDEPHWLHDATDDAAMKRAILQNEFSGRKPKPADVESSFRRWRDNREVAQNLAALRQHSAAVEYRSVDIRDGSAVRDCLNEIRAVHGPVRGLVHAAGVLADQFIEKKTDEQFDRVVGTKVDGMHALLDATRDDDLNFIAFFSSVTARFGREGQVDYAMANEVLNKTAQQLRAQRPTCRVVSIGWGPWDGGMVTTAHKREFARIGVGLIPLEEGARCFVREIAQPPTAPVEVLIGGTFPSSESNQIDNEIEPIADRKSLDNRKVQETRADAPIQTPRVNRGAETPIAHEHFRLTLTPDSPSCLDNHRVGGRPVVPIALMIEWFARAAQQSNSAALATSLKNLRVLRACPVEKSLDITIAPSAAPASASTPTRQLELRSTAAEKTTLHARAEILEAQSVLTQSPFSRAKFDNGSQTSITSAEIYENMLFHGPAFQAIERVTRLSHAGLIAELAVPPDERVFLASGSEEKLLTAPFYFDALLQLGILWCEKMTGAPSLPAFIASAEWLSDISLQNPVRAAVEIISASKHKLTANAFLLDADDKTLAAFHGVEWTIDPSLHAAFFAESGTSGAIT
ncbi:MAG: SDR family NAD(P)-dependent oxidoreductase, partial [Phycisphaerae bacterium]